MKKGFTLIELLLIVSLVFMLGGMGTAFYGRFLGQNTVLNVVDQLASSFRKAQMYAMVSKANSAWGVAWNSSKICVFSGTSFVSRNVAFDEIYSVNSNISIAGLTEVVFSKNIGLPNATLNVTVSGPVSNQSLTLNSQGVVNR